MILTHFLCFIAAPVVDVLAPVTLTQAKAHLRVVDTLDDDYITSLVYAAADKIERDTGLVMRARNVATGHDGWIDAGKMRVPIYRAPVNSVVSITYDAADGTAATLASDQYRLRAFAGTPYIVPAHGVTWPATEAVHGAVQVTVNAGYASNDDVPAGLKHAALLLIGHWFENREAVNVGNNVTPVDLAYEALIRPHRLRLVA